MPQANRSNRATAAASAAATVRIEIDSLRPRKADRSAAVHPTSGAFPRAAAGTSAPVRIDLRPPPKDHLRAAAVQVFRPAVNAEPQPASTVSRRAATGVIAPAAIDLRRPPRDHPRVAVVRVFRPAVSAEPQPASAVSRRAASPARIAIEAPAPMVNGGTGPRGERGTDSRGKRRHWTSPAISAGPQSQRPGQLRPNLGAGQSPQRFSRRLPRQRPKEVFTRRFATFRPAKRTISRQACPPRWAWSPNGPARRGGEPPRPGGKPPNRPPRRTP